MCDTSLTETFTLSKDNWQLRFFRTSPLLFFVFHFPSINICLFRGPGTSLAKLQKFTNLDVPGIRGFPLLSTILGPRSDVWGRYNLIKTQTNSRKHTASIVKSQLLRHINSRNIESKQFHFLSFSCSPKGLFAGSILCLTSHLKTTEGTGAPGSHWCCWSPYKAHLLLGFLHQGTSWGNQVLITNSLWVYGM